MQSDIEYIKKYEPLWGGWYVEELIGEGSFGKVYKIIKEEWGFRYESALKVIRVPTKEQYREAVAVMATSDNSLMDYFEGSVKNIINEIRVMYALKGNSNIVGYEDHMVQRRDDPMGWDIFLRMEYLKTLNKYIGEATIARKDVIKLGIDICAALETCSQRGIIHRDIKDENIFISKYGEFKLGDFGISKELSKSGRAASMKGTPLFMAPEVFRGDKYDAKADLYSLGIVLYRLLNCGRIPLVPPYPQVIRYKDSEEALERRISGEDLNLPAESRDDLGKVVLRACMFNPSDRYIDATQMKFELEKALVSMSAEERNRILTLPGYKKAKKKPLENEADLNKTGIYQGFNTKNQIESSKDFDDIFFDDDIFNDINVSKNLDAQKEIQTNIPIRRYSRGNMQGNILNGGLASARKGWDYYSSANKICRVDIDGNHEQIMGDISAWYINVLEDWIYFTDSGDEDSIYKMGIDGSKIKKLNSDKSWDMTVKGDWIYYSNESDDYKIYKIDLNGEKKERINADKSYCLNITDNWIYYVDRDDSGVICRVGLDGAKKVKLNNVDCDYVNVEGEHIYYVNNNDKRRIYKMLLDGTGVFKINEDISSNINVRDGFVYYSNKSNGGKLYRIDGNGNNKTKLCEDNCDCINITKGWIYYANRGDGGNLYRIKLDGSEREKLGDNNGEEEQWFYL